MPPDKESRPRRFKRLQAQEAKRQGVDFVTMGTHDHDRRAYAVSPIASEVTTRKATDQEIQALLE